MKQPTVKQTTIDYPEETEGSQLASKARKKASKLTAEQRRAHLDAAMVLIYSGENAKEASLPGR
jgi:hypothetical protein